MGVFSKHMRFREAGEAANVNNVAEYGTPARSLFTTTKVFTLHHHIDITDDQEQIVYQANSKFFSIRDKTDVTRADGTQVAHIERKFWTLHERHFVDMADGRHFQLSNELWHLIKDITNIEGLGWQLRGNIAGLNFQLYDEALAIFPGNTSIMNNYAYFLALNNRDLDRAESMAAKAVYANPNNATFIDTYAWVYFKKKNYDMALLYIRSAISNSDAPSSDILEHYGDILFMTGDEEGALKQWEEALKLDSENELLRKKVENKTYYEK